MKISSEALDCESVIKGSTRRIRELLKPPSHKKNHSTFKKKTRSKYSRGKYYDKPLKKNSMIRASLDIKDKDISNALFRTEDFGHSKLVGGGSLFVKPKVIVVFSESKKIWL
jgi:hypothetical protein